MIPCLLVKGEGLVKTERFRRPRYVGDPLNTIRIFNEKEVDELMLLDIGATPEGRDPPFELIRRVADECFMPLCYGGGIRRIEDIGRILSMGVEKVAINSHAIASPEFIRRAVELFGSQSIVVSIDVKRGLLGRFEVRVRGGTRPTGRDPVSVAEVLVAEGAGEVLVNSIDRDGTMTGYDLELIRAVAAAVPVPVVAVGGAGSTADFGAAVEAGASAVAAGSLFVFHGRLRAVLINFPSPEELAGVLT